MRPRSALLALMGLLLVALPAGAQAPMNPDTPFVPDDYLDTFRRIDGDSITFCASSASGLQAFDRALAEAVGVTQLVSVEWEVIRYPYPASPYDFQLGLSAEAIFEALNTGCDVFTGLVLDAGTFPDWLTTTRPYLETGYAIFAPTGTVADLEALAPDSRIGTRLGSGGDALFAAFVATRGEGRYRRIPYPHYRALLNALAAGDVAAAVVWRPALSLAARDGVALPALEPVAGGPSLPEVSFGMTTLADNTFTRALLDDALAALERTGELDRLRDQHGF